MVEPGQMAHQARWDLQGDVFKMDFHGLREVALNDPWTCLLWVLTKFGSNRLLGLKACLEKFSACLHINEKNCQNPLLPFSCVVIGKQNTMLATLLCSKLSHFLTFYHIKRVRSGRRFIWGDSQAELFILLPICVLFEQI